MAQINLNKVTTAQRAPVGKLGIFVTPDNEAFLIDENNAIYAFGGGATSFLALSDTPLTYIGQAGKIPIVNLAETALEFITPVEGATTFLELTDTPATYTGQAGKIPVVNIGETALEFLTRFDGNPSSLNQEGATAGQVLTWDGSQWSAETAIGATYTAGDGLT